MRLEAKRVSFRYHKRQQWVLRGMDFGVERGECVGVLAPSGYGKTTLAMLLAGYLTPSEGRSCWTECHCHKKVSVQYS